MVVLPLRVAGQSRLVALSHLDEINWFAAVLVEPAYVHSMSRFRNWPYCWLCRCW